MTLPPGFHATVVAEGLGPVRHLTIRENGDIYVSTPVDKQNSGGGIIALHLDANHKAEHAEHFGTVEGGTGIRYYNGALYATTSSAVYRFTFSGKALLPTQDPEVIVDGMPTSHPGFNRANRPLAFDGKGHLFVGLEASANTCDAPNAPEGAAPAGNRVTTRAGADWLLVGDAAGFLDPFTGEGLHRALRSAELAAGAVDGFLSGDAGALAAYDRRLARRTRSKDLVSLLVQAFLEVPPLFDYAARRLAGRPAVRETMGLVIGDLAPASAALDPRFLAGLLRP